MGLGSLSRLSRAMCVNTWGRDQRGCCRGLAVSCNSGPCQLRECRAGSVERGSPSCRLSLHPFWERLSLMRGFPCAGPKTGPLLTSSDPLRLMGPDFLLLWWWEGRILSLYLLPQCLLVATGGQDGGLQGTNSTQGAEDIESRHLPTTTRGRNEQGYFVSISQMRTLRLREVGWFPKVTQSGAGGEPIAREPGGCQHTGACR